LAERRKKAERADDLRVLSIDIGGTGLKASVVDRTGRMLAPKRRILTPYPCPPATLIDAVAELVAPLPEHNHLAIGFPGVVRKGAVLTAPHFGNDTWHGFALAETMSERFGGPARVVNDAELQGLGIVRGKGLEFVLTLGTGAGTALFDDGLIMPHLELAHHPIYKTKTYNTYIGDKALKKIGKKHWRERVGRTIDILTNLLNFDHLFIGGGNARHLRVTSTPSITVVWEDAAFAGGAALWSNTLPKAAH
jgi:polyphosphate glucokinase